MRFIPERPVPVMVTRIFELPVQISCRFTPREASQPAPIAYLVLQADSADLQIRHERAFYVSDRLLLAGAYSDGGYHMVYQPSDRPSARKLARELMMLRRRTGSAPADAAASAP